MFLEIKTQEENFANSKLHSLNIILKEQRARACEVYFTNYTRTGFARGHWVRALHVTTRVFIDSIQIKFSPARARGGWCSSEIGRTEAVTGKG